MKAGETMAWATGVAALAGLAIPVGLFADLTVVCQPSRVGASLEATGTVRPTLIWLELAGLRGRGPAVLTELRSGGLAQCARMAVGASGMLVVLYVLGLSLVSFLVGRAWSLAGSPGVARLARVLVGIVFLAAACHAVQIAGMLAMLREPPRLELAVRTGWCAALKYGLLGIVLGAIGLGGLTVPFRAARRDWSLSVLAGVVGAAALVLAASVGVQVAEGWATMPGG